MWLIKSSIIDLELRGLAHQAQTMLKAEPQALEQYKPPRFCAGRRGRLPLSFHFVHEVDDAGIRVHGESFTLCLNTTGYLG